MMFVENASKHYYVTTEIRKDDIYFILCYYLQVMYFVI